jgi:enoyl-CoA hydratase
MIKDVASRVWRNFRLSLDRRILTVALEMEGSDRNDFNAQAIEELTELAHSLHRSTEIDVILLTGRSDVFSAGTNPAVFKERFAAGTLLERRRDTMPGADMVEAWGRIEAVTIAAIEGRCRGAASVLALHCDFRIMGDGVEFFFPEVPNGMILGWGAIPRLVALIGPARTKRLVMLGDPLDAATCKGWGLAEEATAKGESMSEALKLAQKLAKLPSLAVRMTKEAVDAHATAHNAAAISADRYRYLLAGHVRAGHLE